MLDENSLSSPPIIEPAFESNPTYISSSTSLSISSGSFGTPGFLKPSSMSESVGRCFTGQLFYLILSSRWSTVIYSSDISSISDGSDLNFYLPIIFG